MLLEVEEQLHEYTQGKPEDVRDGGSPVFGQRHTEVLLQGACKHLVGFKHGARLLQNGQEKFERKDLRPHRVRPTRHIFNLG